MIRRYLVHFLFSMKGYSIPFTRTMVGDGSEAAKVAWRAVVMAEAGERRGLAGISITIESISPLN